MKRLTTCLALSLLLTSPGLAQPPEEAPEPTPQVTTETPVDTPRSTSREPAAERSEQSLPHSGRSRRLELWKWLRIRSNGRPWCMGGGSCGRS